MDLIVEYYRRRALRGELDPDVAAMLIATHVAGRALGEVRPRAAKVRRLVAAGGVQVDRERAAG